jgi:outer membrane receptor protein involved in Fe transport
MIAQQARLAAVAGAVATLLVHFGFAGVADAQIGASKPTDSGAPSSAPMTMGSPGLEPAALRLTGEELERRGASNLAQALDLLPALNVRQGGRGVVQVDVRGARDRSLLVRIDGVPIDEPYYGVFDLTAIPVTDIEEIRVSWVPASPLDGPCGSGGVIDVITREASGPPRVWARAQGSSAPGALAAATAAAPAWGGLAGRLSAGGALDARDYATILPNGQALALGEGAAGANVALRLQDTLAGARITGDAFFETRKLVVPPNDEMGAEVLQVNSETAFRGDLAASARAGDWGLYGLGYTQLLRNDQSLFADATRKTQLDEEQLAVDASGVRAGAMHALGSRAALELAATWGNEGAHDLLTTQTQTTPATGRANVAELAAGVSAWPVPTLTLDASVGAAVGLGPSVAWPEAWADVRWRPGNVLSLHLTVARKGRLPTLRERYQPLVGNGALRPEIADFAEVGVDTEPWWLLRLAAAGWGRYTQDAIRFNSGGTQRVNVGNLAVEGIDGELDVAPGAPIGAGAAVDYIRANAADVALGALENLPGVRVDGWIDASWHARAGVWARVRRFSNRVTQGQSLGAFTLMEASAWARLGAGLRASLFVENAFDARYLVQPTLTAAGRTFFVTLDGEWE